MKILKAQKGHFLVEYTANEMLHYGELRDKFNILVYHSNTGNWMDGETGEEIQRGSFLDKAIREERFAFMKYSNVDSSECEFVHEISETTKELLKIKEESKKGK